MHSQLHSPQNDLLDLQGAARSFESRVRKLDGPQSPDVELVIHGMRDVLACVADLGTACTIVLGRYAGQTGEDAA